MTLESEWVQECIVLNFMYNITAWLMVHALHGYYCIVWNKSFPPDVEALLRNFNLPDVCKISIFFSPTHFIT